MMVGVVGVGRWGSRIYRALSKLPGAEPVAVRRDDAPTDVPGPRFTQMLADASVPAVVIATPTAHHADAVKRCLLAGKHVLVEKPLCTSAVTARALQALAAERGTVLWTGHIFVHHPAFRVLRAELDGAWTMYGTWHKPVAARLDPVWELLPHPVSIAIALAGSAPQAVTGRHAGDRFLATLRWSNGTTASAEALPPPPNGWRVVVTAASGAAFEWTPEGLSRTVAGTRNPLTVPSDEPLAVELSAFLRAVRTGRHADVVSAASVVSTVAAALESAAGAETPT